MPGKNPRKGTNTDRTWDVEEIRELIDVLVERDVAEFEMERNGLRIRVRRSTRFPEPASATSPAASPVAVIPVNLPATPVSPVGHIAVVPASAAETESGSAASAVEAAEDLYIIKSPIVGTFYSAPTPNAPPFVKPGDAVQMGQVLCIIEAMKLMNEIESEVAGEIVKAYVENGQPVEYGQSLFAIKPSHKK